MKLAPIVPLVLLALGLCSCAHTPPEPKPEPAPAPEPQRVEKQDDETFVWVASVHSVPFTQEPQPNAWARVCFVLQRADIRTSMTASAGVASVSVERKRSRDAVELLRKDAAEKGYWLEIAKEFR
jgi:hypothetical protein